MSIFNRPPPVVHRPFVPAFREPCGAGFSSRGELYVGHVDGISRVDGKTKTGTWVKPKDGVNLVGFTLVNREAPYTSSDGLRARE
jgi:hypothetical protein